jgi:hypothetical protein
MFNQEKFEDTKGVLRCPASKGRQYSADEKNKMINNDI